MATVALTWLTNVRSKWNNNLQNLFVVVCPSIRWYFLYKPWQNISSDSSRTCCAYTIHIQLDTMIIIFFFIMWYLKTCCWICSVILQYRCYSYWAEFSSYCASHCGHQTPWSNEEKTFRINKTKKIFAFCILSIEFNSDLPRCRYYRDIDVTSFRLSTC